MKDRPRELGLRGARAGVNATGRAGRSSATSRVRRTVGSVTTAIMLRTAAAQTLQDVVRRTRGAGGRPAATDRRVVRRAERTSASTARPRPRTRARASAASRGPWRPVPKIRCKSPWWMVRAQNGSSRGIATPLKRSSSCVTSDYRYSRSQWAYRDLRDADARPVGRIAVRGSVTDWASARGCGLSLRATAADIRRRRASARCRRLAASTSPTVLTRRHDARSRPSLTVDLRRSLPRGRIHVSRTCITHDLSRQRRTVPLERRSPCIVPSQRTAPPRRFTAGFRTGRQGPRPKLRSLVPRARTRAAPCSPTSAPPRTRAGRCRGPTSCAALCAERRLAVFCAAAVAALSR